MLSEAKNIYSEIPQKRMINVDSKLQLILNVCAEKTEEDIGIYFDDAEKNGTLFLTNLNDIGLKANVARVVLLS